MTMTLHRLRASASAMSLLLLALSAHLALGMVSATHHARMLASGSGDWAAICTQYGIKQIALPLGPGALQGLEDTQSTLQVADCPVCFAASVVFLPPSPFDPVRVTLDALADPLISNVVEPATDHVGLIPPARAPPVLS